MMFVRTAPQDWAFNQMKSSTQLWAGGEGRSMGMQSRQRTRGQKGQGGPGA